MSKHLATVGRENSLLTGRNLQQIQPQGAAAICRDPLQVRGKRERQSRAMHHIASELITGSPTAA